MAKSITEVLGIEYPILQGAMAWISDAGMAAAVSNAGGAGIISAGGRTTDYVRDEIRALKQAVGNKVLKVIIETCLLTDAEKETMCGVVCEAGADFIKTSTGFSTGGATFDDIALFARCVKGRCRIKAAGGIRSVADMERFIALGADRLGTSSAIKIFNNEASDTEY